MKISNDVCNSVEFLALCHTSQLKHRAQTGPHDPAEKDSEEVKVEEHKEDEKVDVHDEQAQAEARIKNLNADEGDCSHCCRCSHWIRAWRHGLGCRSQWAMG